jgi:hypothetical protein
VEDLVERAAAVHEGERLRLDPAEQRRRRGERLADALGPEDGKPVAWEQRLGAELGHRVERVGPVGDVALDLLRVARVRHGPDEEVAGREDATLRNPGPGVIVRLAAPWWRSKVSVPR